MGNNNEVNGNKFRDFMSDNKKIIIVISAVVVILVGAALGYTLSIKNKVKAWEHKIYTGVHAYGVNLAGMTKEEAAEVLQGELLDQINNKTVTVKVGDKTFQLSYKDIGIELDTAETVEAALNYGKDYSVFKQNSIIKNGEEHAVTINLKYNEDAIKAFANRVNDAVKVDAVDAKISINYGNISITPEATGMQLDVDKLAADIASTINPDVADQEVVSIELQEYSPKIKAEDLAKINGVIGTYSDTFNNNGDGRATNVALATEYINGTVLMPGEEFSYNQTIGETTAERGYKEANTYVGSEVVPGYGGGVCQVSTALYRAVMRANVRSTIRYNHSMTVSYSKPSLDATVAEGDIDYRFINTYDAPLYIEGYIAGSSIVFNVYGATELLGGKTYDLVSEITSTIDYSTEYVNDSTLEAGKEVVTMNGSPGYTSEGYLVTYENGVEVNRELISSDYYMPLNKIVKKGTKKKS